MPWSERTPVAPKEHQKCKGCGWRYWQRKETHLCRACEKDEALLAEQLAAGHRTAYAREVQEAADRLAERTARLTAPRRVIIVDGREFEVVWDGQTPLVYH